MRSKPFRNHARIKAQCDFVINVKDLCFIEVIIGGQGESSLFWAIDGVPFSILQEKSNKKLWHCFLPRP
jgi:hypothetical protein